MAAKRQGLGEKLGLEQQFGIGAPCGWEPLDHGSVASQFLVNAKKARAQVCQRIEPGDALDDAGQGVDARIAAAQVGGLVSKDQHPLVVTIAGLEVGRRYDLWPQQPDEGGADARVLSSEELRNVAANHALQSTQ